VDGTQEGDMPAGGRLSRWFERNRRALRIGVPLAAVALVGIAALLALITFGDLLGERDGVGAVPSVQSSPSPPESTPDPTPEPMVPSPEATPSPTPDQPQPTPEPTATGGSWTQTAGFDGPGADYITDVITWRDEFVAIGRSWETLALVSPGAPRVWQSADGRSWDELAVTFDPPDVEPAGIAELPDGRLLVVGAYNADELDAVFPTTTAAWVSTDARTWTQVPLPLAGDEPVTSFTAGPRGYAMAAAGDLWFSTDGLAWTRTYEGTDDRGIDLVEAGDEGFVALSGDWGGDLGPLVIASGDGKAWYEWRRIPEVAWAIEVAPIGGDWLLAAYVGDLDDADWGGHTIGLFRSANGLDWNMVLDLNDLTPPDGPKAGQGLGSGITSPELAVAGDTIILTLAWQHCCAMVRMPVGVFISEDGLAWAALPQADGMAAAAVTDGRVLVAAGYTGRGDAAAFWLRD
jgi:hypothetical protein